MKLMKIWWENITITYQDRSVRIFEYGYIYIEQNGFLFIKPCSSIGNSFESALLIGKIIRLKELTPYTIKLVGFAMGEQEVKREFELKAEIGDENK